MFCPLGTLWQSFQLCDGVRQCKGHLLNTGNACLNFVYLFRCALNYYSLQITLRGGVFLLFHCVSCL